MRRSLSWARVKGEEGPVRPRFYPPKTKAEIRTLPIPVKLAGALRRWKLQSPRNELDLIFPMRDGQPIHRSTALRYGLWPALSRAGLRRVNMHSLGHSVRVCVDHGGSTGDRRPGAPWTFEPRGHAEGLLALVQRMLRRTLSTESRRVLCTAIKISRPPREREQRPTHPSVNHWPKHLAAVARFMTGS